VSAALALALAAALAGAPAAPPAAAAPDPAPVAPPPQAAPAAVHSRLGKATPRLGEPFDWEIEVRHAPGERYALPSRLELPPFQAEPGGCRRAEAGREVITTCTVHLALYELGGHDLPGLRLEAATPEGPRVLEVPGPRVEAAGVIDPKAPPEQLTLRDPAGPVALLLPTWRPVWWALGAAAALLALWLGWRAWRRRAARAAAPPPPVPADLRLARRLDALEAERLAEQGRGREHFFRVSEAVREYLEALTGVNAPDLTTTELGAALAAAAHPHLDLAALRAFSEEADLVKYAKAQAGGRECAAALRFARELLHRATAALPTTVVAPPAPPPPAL
jgi:hypothetical protein